MGITTSKEYAELEWPLDILVVFGGFMGYFNFGLIGIRREKNSIYFFMVFHCYFIAVAMLYLFNNMEVPTALVLVMVHGFTLFLCIQELMMH